MATVAGRFSGAWGARVVLAAAVASLVFEQSPGNEAVRTALGLGVLERTQNEWLVGLTVFGLTVVIEGVSSVLITLGLHGPSTLIGRLTDRFRPDSTAPAAQRGSPLKEFLTDVSIALGIGAGLVVMRHHLRSAGTLARDLRIAARATLIVAVVSGIIGVIAAGGIRHAEKVGLETPAQWFVDWATDWRFWCGVFVLVQGVPWALRRLDPRQRDAEEAVAP